MLFGVLLIAVSALLAPPSAAGAAAAPSGVDEARWLRHVIPLPKRARIEGVRVVRPAEVGIRLRAGAGELERAAAEELAGVFAEKAGVNAPSGKGFEILIGVCDAEGRLDGRDVPGASELARLPNREQAYRIAPLGQGTLALAALDEHGVYYAAVTLRHLLRARMTPERAEMPLAEITDWPDLAERGEWGGSAAGDIEWLAERKMNLVEVHSDLSLDAAGRGRASLSPVLLGRGRRHAVKVVPIITHLDQLDRAGLFERYPELKGVGESARRTSPTVQVPCLSQPRTSEVLADWIAALAAQPGVTDVNLWLSEHALQCGCEACRKEGQYVLEARAAVRGWELARQRHPGVRLRILLTQGSYPTNDRILVAVPPEVGVTYYDGGRTYDSSRNPMITPLLAEFAAKGRWLGCYPQVTASWRVVSPWSGPQFIRARMNEFVAKGLQSLCGYATPNNRLYDFNVTAAAEWSWNAGGRDERAFAAAWATTRGMKDPERVAEWAVLLGPVGWDVYGSGVPYPAFFGSALRLIRERQAPKWGEGMFRYFPGPAKIAEDLAVCDRALALAVETGVPELVSETRVLSGYLRMLQAFHPLAAAVAGSATPGAARAEDAARALEALDAAGADTAAALAEWEGGIAQGIGGGRFDDTVNSAAGLAAAIAPALAPLGIRDPGRPYRPRQAGAWQTEDFEERAAVTKTWEVTDLLDGPGRYEVRFRYASGWWGLRMTRAALVSAPRERPAVRAVVSEDAHEGEAAYRSHAHVYALALPAHDAQRRYFLTADIQGVGSAGKPENRRGCSGEVWLRKLR